MTPSNSEALACVDGKLFTAAEIDAMIASQLQEIEERKYQLRRAALEHRINQMLLDQAARAQGLSVNSLILNRAPAIDDNEVERVFERDKDQLPPGTDYSAKEQIRDSLEKSRKQRAYRDTIRDLRSRSSVQVYMSRPTVQPNVFQALEGPSSGPAAAPLTLVVFSDYQCGYCRKSQELIRQLSSKYGGRIRIIHKNLVAPDNAGSLLMAKAALCADKQEAFSKYHDLLFAETKAPQAPRLTELAGNAGIDAGLFNACLDSDVIKTRIDQERKEATSVGARATPFFLLNGQVFRGIQPLEEFELVIRHLLRESPAQRHAAVR